MTPRVLALSRSTPRNRSIVVFPHAGGSPRYYSSWCRELPAGADLYGVTYPGRDLLLDERAPDTLVDLASDCATEVEPIIRLSDSVVMFGHSMGSNRVAFGGMGRAHPSRLACAGFSRRPFLSRGPWSPGCRLHIRLPWLPFDHCPVRSILTR